MKPRWILLSSLAVAAAGAVAWLSSAHHSEEMPNHASDADTCGAQLCSDEPSAVAVAPKVVDLRALHLSFPTPYIPAQCYAKTQGSIEAQGLIEAQGSIERHDHAAAQDQPITARQADAVRNPCYTCHQDSRAPNYIEDEELQIERTFPAAARENPWSNLFVDRSSTIATISDAFIESYVRTDNYHTLAGHPILGQLAREVPADWDVNSDGQWSGYVPDAQFSFDDAGFDRRKDGSYTGWRALAYYPLEGAFLPTNGSFGDVLIRLPDAFRQTQEGQGDNGVYAINLAVLEALIKRENVPIDAVDETKFGVDLDKDGKLATAHQVTYDWDPRAQRFMSYVGRARDLTQDGSPAAGLFPRGTEFLHSVRYLDVQGQAVVMAPRLKELRYARKKNYLTYGSLEQMAFKEAREKHDSPDKTRQVRGDAEHGVLNSQGWIYQGFIEDQTGDLRPQSFEEHVFCVGCHGGVGATTDGIFSMQRKLPSDSPQHGWFHWSQASLYQQPEPKRADGSGYYAAYLRHARSVDDFQGNSEGRDKFDPSANPDALAQLSSDVSALLLPSPRRALDLNKAYLSIVREQSFAYGRDATVQPPPAVLKHVAEDELTGIEVAVTPPWRAVKLGAN